MASAWFDAEFLAFLSELSANNTSEWFDANRKRYENSVKKPFHAFVAEMISRIGREDPRVAIEPKDAIFRINRDIRFSKDKSPYKTNASANISPVGRKSKETPGFYIQFGSDGAYLGGGAYVLEPDSLKRVRAAIAADIDAFGRIVAEPAFTKLFDEVKGERAKILPPELKPALEKQPLVANKQLYYMAHLPADVVLKPELPDLVMERYRAGRPLNQWLERALTPA